MIKLIACDMDGTLLDTTGNISNYNATMIKSACDQGIEFIIASGRSYSDIQPIINKVDLKCGCITGNGAEYVESDGKLISSFYLPYEQALISIQLLSELEIHFMIYCTDGVISIVPPEDIQEAFIIRGVTRNPEKTYEEVRERLMKHHSVFKMSMVADYQTYLKDKKIIKIEAFDTNLAKIEMAKQEIRQKCNVSYLSSFPDNVEITHLEATKGNILDNVRIIKKLNKEEVMVMGDSFNDISMFELFENSVAMANGENEIKNLAKYITDEYFNDGVGKAIDKWILAK